MIFFFVVVFVFLFDLVGRFSKLSGYRMIRRARVGAFRMYSAHAQWYALHAVCKRSDNGQRTQRQEFARRLIGGSSLRAGRSRRHVIDAVPFDRCRAYVGY